MRILQDVEYTYDPVGNITEITDYSHEKVFHSGQVVEPKSTFTYDALYRLTKAEGREHLSLNNPVISNYELDKYCFTFDNANSNDLQALANYERNYQYDQNNNLTQIQHQTLGAGNTARNFTRDILPADGSNKAVPTDMLTGGAVPEDFFDVNGNCINLDHLETIEYNYRDNISKVKKNGVSDYEYYIYNSSGDRVRKISVVGGVETHKIYLGGVEITRVYEPAGSLKLERWDCHVMDDTSRIAIVNSWTVNTLPGTDNPPAGTTKTRYQYGNHLGSASLELDDQGNVISYEEYFPYGGSAFMYGDNLKEVKLKEYRFTGKERDEFTGLYYFGARYYAPWIGRWMSADPKRENEDGLNLYAYVRNNPVTLVDPNGEEAQEINKKSVLSRAAGAVKQSVGNRLKSYGNAIKGAFSKQTYKDIGNAFKFAGTHPIKYTQMVANQLDQTARAVGNQLAYEVKNLPNSTVEYWVGGATEGVLNSAEMLVGAKVAPVVNKKLNGVSNNLKSKLPGKKIDVDGNISGLKKGPIKPNEVTTYDDFVKRSVVGDNLEGHEVLQHANLQERNLATTRLSTEASKKNPVIALDKTIHKDVNAAQRSLSPRVQSGVENIKSNVQILKENKSVPNKAVKKIKKMAIEHDKNL